MAQQKAAARAAWKGSGERASDEIWFDLAEANGSSEFTGYTSTEGEGEVIAIVKDGQPVETAEAGDTVVVLTNQTPFYGESGGQMGDAGTITTLEGAKANVEDTGKPLGQATAEVHVGADFLTYFAGHAELPDGRTYPVDAGSFVYSQREPYGVVGAISPWNYPVTLALVPLATAIAAGGEPLNGMCVAASPASARNSSIVRCAELGMTACTARWRRQAQF